MKVTFSLHFGNVASKPISVNATNAEIEKEVKRISDRIRSEIKRKQKLYRKALNE